MRKGTGLKRAIVNTLLVCASMAFCLICAEAVTRSVCPYLNEKYIPKARTSDEDEIHKKIYRISSEANIDYEPVYEKTSRPGYSSDFHSREFRIEKGDDVFRIIGVGDSHLYEHDGNDLTTRLEQELNDLSTEKTFEVLNFGVGGYNLVQKKILLDERVKKYHPDLLLIQLLDDDCEIERIFLPKSNVAVENTPFFEVAYGLIIPLSIPLPAKVNRELLRLSHFYRFLSLRIHTLKKRVYKNENELEENLVRCEAALNEIIEAAEKINTKTLFFLSHAVRYDFSEYPKYPKEEKFTAWFDRVHKELNIEPVRLFDRIRDHDYRELKADDIGHYRAPAYRIANRQILDELLARRLVPVDYSRAAEMESERALPEERSGPSTSPPKGYRDVAGSALLADFETGGFEKVTAEKRLTLSFSPESFAGKRSLKLFHKGNRMPDPAERVGYLSIEVPGTSLDGYSHFNILARGDAIGGNVLIGIGFGDGTSFRPDSGGKPLDEWSLIRTPLAAFKSHRDKTRIVEARKTIRTVDVTVDYSGGPREEYNLLIDEIYLSR